jgi:hypothetical protein
MTVRNNWGVLPGVNMMTRQHAVNLVAAARPNGSFTTAGALVDALVALGVIQVRPDDMMEAVRLALPQPFSAAQTWDTNDAQKFLDRLNSRGYYVGKT